MTLDGINRQIIRLKGLLPAPGNRLRIHLVRLLLVVLTSTTLVMATLLTLQSGMPSADARALRVSPTASCARLAGLDSTITNGPSWGRTVLPGYGAPGGWFGVDVCSNGINSVSPNGSNVSCDSVKHGCSPTSDGYGWTFQCPELIVRFSAWAFGDNPAAWGRSGGNAPDLWLPVNHPSDFMMYPNGSSTPPVPGDILVWGYLDAHGNPWPAGPDGAHGGHIAVVAAVRDGMVITAEQNVKWGSQDHPTDRLALTRVGSRWVLSGSTQHTTTLPTWRWLRTMGHSRGTYGWLHSVKNTGQFPSARAGSSTAGQKVNTNGQVSQQFPGGLPSLSSTTVVTESGTLADLTWSTQNFFAPSNAASQPQAQVRSLGTPPDVLLAGGQSAATLIFSNGLRYSYVLGADGNLYAARTSPTSLGVFWAALGAPPGVSLASAPVASLFAGGVQVAALGNDGNVWWRAGPPDRLGNWTSLGEPSTARIEGRLALAGAPGSGSPLVFAVGADGHIYMRIWQDAMVTADGTQLPPAWSGWISLGAQLAGARVAGALVIVPEIPSAHNWIGTWPDSPLNLFTVDTNGALWWYRSTRLSSGWTATAISGNPGQVTALLSGVAVASATSTGASGSQSGAIHLYASGYSSSYMCTLPVPGSNGKQTMPAWTTLPVRPSGMSETASSAAVALGPENSALVAAAGDDVLIGGAQSMSEALLPDMAAQASGGKSDANPWVRAGSVPASATFSDGFSSGHLDSRWTRLDASARVSSGGDGLVLIPGAHGVGALMQAAASGDGSLTVRVASPRTLPASGNVGLVLYQDDGDWLTLMVDRAGTVRLCPMMQQSATPCLSGKVSAKSPVWLRLQRNGSTFIALVSGDGTAWLQVGQWSPDLSDTVTSARAPSATSQPTATATARSSAASGTTVTDTPDPATAPLAFTSWGVLAMGNGSATGWPYLTDFVVTPVASA
ncbi:MAG TPA: CHAP domain-containing protein [Ktedonobacterales bacterium]